MTDYHELLKAMMAVIVQYHFTKLGLPKDNELKMLENLSEMTHPEAVAALNALIVASQKNDTTRGPLLMYLLYGVEQLKYLEGNINFIDAASVKMINEHIIQLIINLKHLLETRHSIELTFNYNNKDVKLYGLITFFGSYCISGGIIQKTLFSPLALEAHATDKTIEHIVTHLIELPFLRMENALLKQKNLALEDELSASNDKKLNLDKHAILKKPLTDGKSSALITQQPHPLLRRKDSLFGLPSTFFSTTQRLSEMAGYLFKDESEQADPSQRL